jgi:molecular chaperone GrpE (heat shock protein)
MSATIEPRVSKWPFWAGDLILVLLALGIYFQCQRPLGVWELLLVVLCVALGAILGVCPFILEYRALVKLIEVAELKDVAAQVQSVEKLASQIQAATGQWQSVQEAADKTALNATQIAERIATEARSFQDFLQRANDSEKATLRLEVEKLRRSEGEWLQVLVRVLDHVYAVHQGALRSGQPNLIEQMGHFQNACRDVARRVGLNAFVAREAEAFDAQRHQVVDHESQNVTGGLVDDTIAAGYTFQGRLIRPALVRLRENGAGENRGQETESAESTHASPDVVPPAPGLSAAET